MEKSIELRLDVESHPDRDVVEVHLDSESLPAWCLQLCLLEKHLIESLVVRARNGKFKLKIKQNTTISPSQIGRVRWESDGAELNVSGNLLEMWIQFFLRYYRDGIGDVNHIDIDIRLTEPPNSKKLFLILTIPDAMLALTEHDLKRMTDI